MSTRMSMRPGTRQPGRQVTPWCDVLVATAVVVMVFTGLSVGCVSDKSLKRSDAYYREGVALLPTDQQRAYVAFQRAVRENPEHKEALYYLGHFHAQQGKYDLAEQEFRKVLEIDPDYSEAHTYLGQILAQKGRWDEAIESYREALSNPLYVTPDLARFHLGRALAHQGEMKEAIKVFEDALLVSPPSVPRQAVHLELGRAYYRIGEDGKAREELIRVTSLDKKGPYADAASELLGRLRP